jgi:hypothetical protein
MNIREMHYDFKQKFNKIDSQKNRNLLVPEIDWLLNEAKDLFVKRVATPKIFNGLGFETTQRIIDDIRTIVVPGEWKPVTNSLIVLPDDYDYYVRGRLRLSKGPCKNQEGVLYIKAHTELFQESVFYDSDFEWREVNGTFHEGGSRGQIKLYTDGSFTVDEVFLVYIRKMPYIHNAQDFNSAGSYVHPSGQVLTGSQSCQLPEHTHKEIVDIAVLLAANQIQTSDLSTKVDKLGFNQIV